LRHAEISFGLSSSLGGRLAQMRRHQPSAFQPLRRGVYTAQRDLTAGLLFDFPRDRHAIGILPQAQQRQHHHQLEIAEITPFGISSMMMN
jgi:hypothetical protein